MARERKKTAKLHAWQAEDYCEKDVFDFLNSLQPDGPWLIVSIQPDTNRILAETFAGPSDADVLRIWLRNQQAEFCSMYFSPGVTLTALQKKAKKEDMSSTRFAWCEIDPPKGSKPSDLQSVKDAALSRVKAFPVTACAIIDSGSGIHAHYAFPTPADLSTEEARNEFELVNRALTLALKGDGSCWNCDRILRLPGTVNFPDAKKRAKGRKVALSSIIELNPAAAHTFEALKAAVAPWLEQAAESIAAAPITASLDGWQDLDAKALRKALPGGVQAALQRYLSNKDEDRSGSAYHAVALLHEHGSTVKEARAIVDGQPCYDKWAEKPWEVDKDVVRIYGKTAGKADSAEEFEPIPDEEDAEGPSDIEYVDLWKLADLEAPVREWVVENWLPKGQVSLLPGDGGVGKSLLMIQLAYACAGEQTWLDMPVEPGPVLILSAEDETKEAWFRMRKIREADLSVPQKHRIFFIDATANVDPQLAAWTEKTGVVPTKLFKKIMRDVRHFKIKVVILDSAADVFNEEINRYAVRAFIRLMRTLDCTVIILSHPSVEGMKGGGRGYSGSTHWSNSVRNRLYMDRCINEETGKEIDEDVRVLTNKKANRGKRGGKVFMRWTPQGFIRENEGAEALRTANEEEAFLTLLRKFTKQGLTVSPNAGRAYAPTLFAEHHDNKGIAKAAFKVAMEKLLDAGKIKIETVGPKSKRTQILIEILD